LSGGANSAAPGLLAGFGGGEIEGKREGRKRGNGKKGKERGKKGKERDEGNFVAVVIFAKENAVDRERRSDQIDVSRRLASVT